jgi:hypothetical protein
VFTILFLPTISGAACLKRNSYVALTSSMDEQEASLSGYVTDISMNPLNGALVRVYFHETYAENYSDAVGFYHVEHIPLCYCVKNAACSKPGYLTDWVLLSISENTTYNFTLIPLNLTCYPLFNGTMGTNGWYISCVNVSFVIGAEIDAVFYKLDGGVYYQYTGQFQISANGRHTLSWYSVYQGNPSTELLTTLSIDRDNPDLSVSIQKIGIKKLCITINAFDETSGINRVELYLDDKLFFIIDLLPYEGVITSFGRHNLTVVAIDNAGHSINNTVIVSTCSKQYSYHPGSLVSHLFFLYQFIKQMLLINRNIYS